MSDHPTEVTGVVRELLPRALYRVELDSRHQVVAHAAGGPRRNFIRLIEGDRVLVELSPSDLKRGRITRRLGRNRGAGVPAGGTG